MGEVEARPEALRALVGAIFQAVGSSPDEASCIAGNLVLANLSGHDSHGVGLGPIDVAARAERIPVDGTTWAEIASKAERLGVPDETVRQVLA